ncbi:MAG: urease subunit beta [Pseudohongiellaceae bacterium]|jgi:urease subunit beta
MSQLFFENYYVPGELIIDAGTIEINVGRETLTVRVENSGDRPIQVGSHYHFFETNSFLSFDREKTKGFRLNIASGTAVRFEPGQDREVELVAFGGDRVVYGFRGEVMGPLDPISSSTLLSSPLPTEQGEGE